jgi:FkbM family methyltransferase
MPAFPYKFPGASAQGQPEAVWIRIDGVDDRDHIVRCIRETSTFYEADLLEYLAACGPRGGVYIDVGANIGNHSVFFGRFLAEHVISIEPTPRLIPILKRNLTMNGVSNHTVYACGVGAMTGTAQLIAPPGGEFNVGQTRLQVESADIPDRTGLVPVSTLDDIAQGFLRSAPQRFISLVKIDVEGMELDVLRGATRLLEEHRPQLVIELAAPREQYEAQRFLEDFGYRNVGRFCHTPTFHFIDPSVHQMNERPKSTATSDDDEARHIARAIEDVAVEQDAVIFVDQNEWPPESLPARKTIPFLERQGEYWGPPADEAEAIRELERLRRTGATFIAFVPPAFWWLHHYAGFATHLKDNFRCVVQNERLVMFDLRGPLRSESRG